MDVLEENFNFTLENGINGPVLSAFYALLMVAGFAANVFVIIVTFCHPKSLKQPSTIFLTSLLLADLVVVVFVMPLTVIATASGGWIFGQSIEEKHGVCQFTGFMLWYGVLLVTATLAIVSFDRFLSIVKPLIHKQYMKSHTAVITTVIAWIICALLNTTPLYGFGKFIYVAGLGTCAPVWTGQTLYLVFFFIVLIVFVGIIVVTSIWTCCFTRKFLEQNQAHNNIYVSKNRRVIGIFGSLLLVCGLGFGPGILSGVIRIFVYVPYSSIITIICFYSITIGNPLIQSFFRPDVRDTVKYMFSKCSSHVCSDILLKFNIFKYIFNFKFAFFNTHNFD